MGHGGETPVKSCPGRQSCRIGAKIHPDSLSHTSLEEARKAASSLEIVLWRAGLSPSGFQHAPEQFHILGEGPIALHQLRHTRDGMHDGRMVPIAKAPPDFRE
jgi:hypothetical protein